MVRSLVALIFSALLLAACGGSDNGPVESAESVTAPLVESDQAVSPLESSLGFASDPGIRQYQLLLMQREADAAMVDCMRRAGFYYAVRPAEQLFRSGAFVGDGSRDWTITNGLGITSSFSSALAADAARGSTDAETTNRGYVESLTPEQSQRYDLALVGEVIPDPATAEYEPAGCWGESYPRILQLLAIIDEFEPSLASLNSRLNADPRVLEFQKTWSTCMQVGGYNYVNPSALVDDIYARLLDIELVEAGGTTQVASKEALDALSEYERQAALASFDCEEGFSADLARLRFDYESEFLDDNRFRIADLQQPAS